MFADAVFGEGAEKPYFLRDRVDLFKSSKLVFKVNRPQMTTLISTLATSQAKLPPPPLLCRSSALVFISLTAVVGGGYVRKDTPSLNKGCRLSDGKYALL